MSQCVRRGWLSLAVALASVLVPAVVRAEEAPKPPQTILQGELVDPATYLKTGSHGPEQEDQTYEAVDGGQTLALLTSDNTLYLLLAEEPGEDPNELAYDYVSRQVKVTGRVFERAGLRGIVPTAVELAQPVESPAAQTPPASNRPPTP